MSEFSYTTAGGVRLTRRETALDRDTALDSVLESIDRRRGVVLASSYEYPGRYKRWSMGFVNPPLEIAATGRTVRLTALNARGQLLLAPIMAILEGNPDLASVERDAQAIRVTVKAPAEGFAEEQRSRQPSIFSVLRAVSALFASDADSHLGLYGAFGYDLIYQFDPVDHLKPRAADQRDLLLYLPDQLVVVDYHTRHAARIDYEFDIGGALSDGLARDGTNVDYHGARRVPEKDCDLPPGGYADMVRDAKEYFRRGDLFEVVPGQTFYEPCKAAPSDLFAVLRKINPSPYGFLFNLGSEYLIGASPEMFVRVEGRRIETSPISGTIARGSNAIEDAERIRTLLNSEKDEAELTMCTDVDRNDKARVCEPGTVTVIGRRQIELYSHLIHTVDHVEGVLRPDCDAYDAFLTHCWAVTVTGAPKRAAVAYIEKNETMPRRWYGGAVGRVTFDGNLNTGLTLRTIRLADEIAEVRAGATLLFDSDPDSEERETHLKAAAMRRAIAMVAAPPQPRAASSDAPDKPVPRVLMVDCEDSFVLTLADYLRQTGANLVTLRHHLAARELDAEDWDLVVLSPGPGRPEQFGVPDLVRRAAARRLPLFGVCLGLQGIVEAFGGRLGTLPVPYHGKPSLVRVSDPKSGLFKGLPESFPVGRYHSLYAAPDLLPAELAVTARTEDGVIMAIEHRTLPIWGVQFHPESIMSLGQAIGPGIIANVVNGLAGRVKVPAG
jgi:anthranilate synthase